MSRVLAKALFHLAGWLSRVKTYQRYYVLDPDNPGELKLGGWHWFCCALSTQLLGKSMQLDWDHWDHWACVHDECDPRPCPECDGQVCNEH